jgi:hypothetical protein
MFLLTLMMAAAIQQADGGPRGEVQDLIPPAVRQWTPWEPVRVYAGREIFEYMDGAGEVYLAFGFRSIAVQHYARVGQEEILLEVLDMGSAPMAFGTFTYMQGRGPRVPIGQDGEFKSGLLTFWKDRYFVCVKIDHESDEASAAVMDLGAAVASAIRGEGRRPALLAAVPPEEYEPGSLRYFTRHEILNNHFCLADANILRLTDRTECLLVRLRRDRSYLLLVRYPDAAHADSARASFVSAYMPGEEARGMVRTENRLWTACATRGSYVVVNFDAPTAAQAAQTLEQTLRRLP